MSSLAFTLTLLSAAVLLQTTKGLTPRPDDLLDLSARQAELPIHVKMHVTDDVRLPDAKWREIVKARSNILRGEWKKSGMLDVDIDSSLKEFEAQLLRRHSEYSVEFAIDGDRIFYKRDPVGKKDSSLDYPLVVYYDGKTTYKLVGNTLHILPRKDLSSIDLVPLLGIRLPYLTLVQKPSDPSRDQLQSGAALAADVYFKGARPDSFGTVMSGFVTIRQLGSRRVLDKLYSISVDRPYHTVSFENYNADGLAMKAVISSFHLPEGAWAPTQETERVEIRSVRSVTNSPMVFTNQHLLKMMKKGDPIVVEEADRSTSTVFFDKEDKYVLSLLGIGD